MCGGELTENIPLLCHSLGHINLKYTNANLFEIRLIRCESSLKGKKEKYTTVGVGICTKVKGLLKMKVEDFFIKPLNLSSSNGSIFWFKEGFKDTIFCLSDGSRQ